MEVFLFWILIIILLLGGYYFVLMKRSPKGYRLQVKLTTIFILLILIPTIPLTLIVSALLTQGVEIFLVPGVESSLETSLQILKKDLEARGLQFIEKHPGLSNIKADELDRFDISYRTLYQLENRAPRIIAHVSTDFGASKMLDEAMIPLLEEDRANSRILTSVNRSVCEVYFMTPDSVVALVGFDIDSSVVQAKDQISESLKMYKSLSLFKDSIIQGRLIWGLATLLILGLTFLAVLAARILSKGISGPIQQLAAGMQRVAEGDLTSSIDVKARDEINILVESFNKMRNDLHTSQTKLVNAERLAAWRDVARRISHEIRNSLTPIQISLHRIRMNVESSGNQLDESLKAIQDEIESLKKFSEEFSQFARMPQMEREKNDVNEIIQDLVPMIEGESKPVKFKLELDFNLDPIDIDRDQIRRAIHNLIKNSVDASEVGMTIFIKTTSPCADIFDAVIEISDRGCGMSNDVLQNVFEPYFTTKQRGMGLGLSIVKRIIEDHDGTIEISSTEGKGTTVHVNL